VATSGSKNYSITRATIIEGALRKLGEFDQGESISGDETNAAVNAAVQALNLLTKEWSARGADIWLRDTITLFLQPNTKSYALGTANATAAYVETTLSAAEASGQTVLSITDTTGMTTADKIGVKLDDDTIHWSTVTVDSSTQGTIASGLASAAASGNKVYAYTTTAGRPTKISFAYRSDINGLDTEIRLVGENEYLRLSNKSSDGPPVEVWYQPTLTTGTLYVWPDNGGKSWDKIVMSVHYHADDFDSASDNPEFPIEWGNALIWGLAAELAAEYGLPIKEIAYFENKAEHKLNVALDWDVENADVIITLDLQGR